MTLRTDVSVLYVDPRGPYPKLVADWWDEKRDARNYAGPNPVVAHPPCGPWGRMRQFSTRQPAELGPIAVGQLRRWGGVLEHPAYSRLWNHCQLPTPGAGPDAFGGSSYELAQVTFGHVCEKKTWLYAVGCPLVLVPQGGAPSKHIRNRKDRPGRKLPWATKLERRATPPAFAEWLISLAAQARLFRTTRTTEPPSAASHLCGAVPHRGETDGRGGVSR